MDAPAFRSLFPFEADVFEVSSVPERIEIAFQACGVVDVARFGIDSSLDRLRGNAPVAVHHDFGNHILLSPTSRAKQNQKSDQEIRQQAAWAAPLLSPNPS